VPEKDLVLMLLQIHERLEERLIRILAGVPCARVSWIQKSLSAKFRPYTFQAIYKELSKLQKAGIVVKAGEEYRLKLSWISDLTRLVNQMHDTHLAASSLAARLSQDKSKIKWNFSNLLKMDDYWGHLVLDLFRNSGANAMYEWLPHPWFELIHREKEDRFRKVLRRSKKRIYMIVGGSSYLDRICRRYWPAELYEYSFTESPFENKRSEYIDVIGEYILTIKLTRNFSQRIDDFYQQISCAKEVQASEILDLFTAKTSIQMILERNKRKASLFKKKFSQFFGITQQLQVSE
jgi:hypothetical protein